MNLCVPFQLHVPGREPSLLVITSVKSVTEIPIHLCKQFLNPCTFFSMQDVL